MRIILLVVFYIVAYVARTADGRDTARTSMLGNSVKHIFRQKSKITQGTISEPVDDEIIQKINKHSKQSLLVNRIDGFSQNKKHLAQIERNLRRKKRRAEKLSKLAHRPNDDTDEENVSSNVARLQKHPIWQVPESTIATVNLNQTIAQTEVINRSSLMSTKSPKLQLKNLDSDRSVNETILSKHSDLQKLSDKNISNKNFVLCKIADPKLGNESAKPAFKKLNDEIPLPAHFLPSTTKNISSRNKANSFDYHPTSPNERFLLVPISKDLYMLKNIRDSPRIDTDRIITSEKSVEKNKDNATSAMLSFKAPLHHDVKNVGKAYRRKYFNNYHLSDHNANYLYPDHRVFKENTSPAENSIPPSYPTFLYPGIGFQTHPNLIDVASEISDKQIIHRVPDYENTSSMDRDINFDGETDSLLPSSTSFEMPYYDATSYFKKDNRQSNILSAVKLSKINQFQPENSLGYNEFGVESTTIDFRNIFNTLDYNIDAPITVGMLLTSVDKKIFDITQSVEEASEFSTKRSKDDKMNFMDFSTQYGSAFDESAIKDNTFVSNKFIDDALFNNYTTRMDLFLNAEDHTRSDANKWPVKKKQFNANPRALIMALKPLTSDLQKLLSAVELVNQSISNVQSKLCDKKNIVRSTKIKKSSKKRNFNNQFLNNRIKTKSKVIANQATNNMKLKKRRNFLFLNKLTTPFYKRDSSKSLKIQNGHRNFPLKRKLNEKKFPKLGDVERRRMPHLRFNRNLKSLTKNYEARKIKPAPQFTKFGFKKITHTTAPILTLSRLIKSNVSSKNNFLNRLSLSKNKSFLHRSTKKNNQAYFLSNNERNAAQHNAKRAMQRETNSSDKYFPIDPQSHREMTAYQEILGFLDMTKKPRVEHPTVVTGTVQNVTESLLIFTTAEFFVTTTTASPYFIEEHTTVEYPFTVSTLIEMTTVTMIPEILETTSETTESSVALSFVVTTPTTLPLFYTTESTTLLTEEFTTESSMLLTPLLEGMTDVTLRITIPAVTEISIKETTEKETITSTTSAMELTSLLTETSTSLYTFSTAPLFTTVGTKSSIQVTTPVVPVSTPPAITERPQTTTSTGETISVTERAITVTTIESTTALGGRTTLHEAVTSMITYITRIVTEMEDVTPFSTRTVTFATHVPTNASETIPKELETKVLTTINVTAITESTIKTSTITSEIITPTISPTISEETETILSTEAEVTASIPEEESPITQIEKTSTAEEMTTTEIPTITRTLMPTNLTTIKILTTIKPFATTKIPTTIESTTITRTLMPTNVTTISTTETLTPTETPTITKLMTTTETSTTIESTTRTLMPTTTEISTTETLTPIETPAELSTTTEISTTIESTTISEISTTSKIPTITKIATITESETTIEILTPTKTTTETPEISEISTTSEAPIITETITKALTPIEILTIISTPTIIETPIIIQTSPIAETIIEIPATTESSTITETPTITSIYITTPFSIESTVSSVITTFPMKEFTSITPTIFSTSTSAFSITPVTTISFETTVPVTLLELTTATLSPLITNITLRETPYTTISPTLFITTEELLIFTTISTTEMFLTTSSILENATVFGTITTEIYESTITTPPLTKIPIATPMTGTEATSYETTPIVIFTTFATEIAESTTPTSTISPLETYEASTEETTVLTKEERITSWITTEKTTMTEVTTPTTYLSSLTRPFFIESTTETTAFEMVTSPTPEKITVTSEKISPVEEVTAIVFITTTEETSSMEEITNITTIGEISTPIFSTEKSTTATTETSLSLAITISLAEITTETVEASLITTTTETPEYTTTTEVAFTPFFEFTESALITKASATTLEVITVLPGTEEFTTESPAYTTESSAIFTEMTTPTAISISTASAEEMPEIETEYYIAQGPQYEEYEDYDEEIPTDVWYDYEAYETTKKEILSTVKYTKPEKESTSSFFEKVTTVYETEISKLTTYSTSAAAYTPSISSTPCTYAEEFTSTLKASIIAESTTTSEAETESTASTASEVEESTTGPTFGTTEEYSLPSSTVFEITTKPLPLEYPKVSPEYTESTISTLEASTETTRNLTLPKFVTKPKEIPERTTTSERILTETTIKTVETSFFVSSVPTALSEKEAVEVHVTTVSTASLETAVETEYESTTRATTTTLITEEEYVTPFTASETEFEFTTTSETVGPRDQLQQQLDRLKEHEREMAEREERLKERERQWEREKEERLQMMREKGEMENITSTITGHITTAAANLTTLIRISTESLTASTSTEIEIPSALVTTSLPEIVTISIPFYSTEEIIPVTYTAEMTEQIITEESTTYATMETEELAVTDYIIFTPYITAPITDLYGIGTVETATPYSIEETYTASYETVYVSEPSFTPPTLLFTTTTSTSSAALAISTEAEYEEIEKLKEELRKRERELEEREKILLEREKKLKRDILEFEKCIKEFEKEITDKSSKKSTVSTSLSTPVPPIEKTTEKLEVTTLALTEKKENLTTKATSLYRTTKVEGIEERGTTPLQEEEIVTRRICLNVLENTTIPFDKIRRGIATKKICLPYFPEKNEKEKSVGRLSRKPLAFQRTREFRQPKYLSDFRFRKKRHRKASTRKISNLQLLHHEWLSNETVKPLQHFKSFTRIYQKTRKPFLRNVAIIDAQKNAINNLYNRTFLYEHRVFDHYKNFFQSTTKSMLHSEKYEKRNAILEYNLIPALKRQKFFNNDKVNIKKRDISATKKNVRFLTTKNTVNIPSQKATTAIAKKKELNNDEDEFYTVNVAQLSYDENEETHKIISAKPDKNDLTVITITTPFYELEEDLKEEDDGLSEETERKIEEENDDIDDMVENYMNYEEHEMSTLTYNTKFLDKNKNERMTEGKAELLDQIWPTEKITTYHLGGTRYWELDFDHDITEPSVSSIATDKSKTLDLSVTKTTCFHVILKNESYSDSEMKHNIHHHKRNIYKKKTNKYSMEKRDIGLENVTRKNILRNKPRRKWPGATMKELRYNLQNLRGSNHYKRNSEQKRMVKPDEFPLSVSVTDNESSIIARSRKLCGVKEKKKHKITKHKDAVNIKNKTKLAKSQKSHIATSHPLKNTDSCITNKKNSDKRHKTMIAKTTTNFHVKKSVAHPNVIVNHKNKPISHERKLHDCLNCICDIMNVINDVKSILDKTSFPLDEIKALNCSKYKEIQDKIVISMNSDMEEAKEFPQPHYNTEFLKGQKYIKLEELENDFKSDDLELDNDYDIISLPGLNLNLPCSQDGDGITWLSSISRPSYTWKRTDGTALFGFVAENGDLELRNVNAKDTGNYTCVITYMGPDNEEPVETTYEVHLQVVTLPRYVLYGENRYHIRSCDEQDMDALVTYLPLKLNSVICEEDLCNAYVLPPSCTRNQITVNILIVPSHIVKLMTVDPRHCNVLCLKAIQDKLSLILSRNLQIFLGKIIIFRLPYYEQRLVPIAEKASRWKRGRTGANTDGEKSSNIGVFSSCPAGYGLHGTRCVPCNMGTYSEDGISHCKKCPPGTYQPNHGARVCRTCTNPLTKGCYNMLWNSFSAVMVTLASFSVMLSIFLLLLWIICCAKKKFCTKKLASIVPNENTIEQEKHPDDQPLIKDVSENEDQQWDREYRIKKKRGKFYVNKRRRKQNERKKYEKMHAHKDEWGSHRIKNAPIICPDSYRSHEDYNNYYPKQSYRQGPRLPECDFDT